MSVPSTLVLNFPFVYILTYIPFFWDNITKWMILQWVPDLCYRKERKAKKTFLNEHVNKTNKHTHSSSKITKNMSSLWTFTPMGTTHYLKQIKRMFSPLHDFIFSWTLFKTNKRMSSPFVFTTLFPMGTKSYLKQTNKQKKHHHFELLFSV